MRPKREPELPQRELFQVELEQLIDMHHPSFDKNLAHAVIGGKDIDRGSAELRLNLVWTHGHGSLFHDL